MPPSFCLIIFHGADPQSKNRYDFGANENKCETNPILPLVLNNDVVVGQHLLTSIVARTSARAKHINTPQSCCICEKHKSCKPIAPAWNELNRDKHASEKNLRKRRYHLEPDSHKWIIYESSQQRWDCKGVLCNKNIKYEKHNKCHREIDHVVANKGLSWQEMATDNY